MRNNRLWIILTLLVIALSLTITACGEDTKAEPEAAAPATIQDLSVQEAYDAMRESDDAIFIDVREQQEWDQIHAVGTDLIPLSVFEQRATDELPKDGEIYIICNSGNRSRTAAEYLLSQGYTNVHNIEGGTQAWVTAGLPAE